MCAGHVTYLVNKMKQKWLRQKGHLEKIYVIVRTDREKEEKENSVGSKNARYPSWSMQENKTITEPPNYQWAKKEQAL